MNGDLREANESRLRLSWPILLVMLFGLIQLPFSSFMADDLILLGQLEKVSPLPGSAPFNLYTLAEGNAGRIQQAKESGAFPWFFHPRFKLNFFRPLSSALLALDHWLFGLHPLGYAVHSLIWLMVLVGGVGTLYRRFLPGPTGRLAGTIFALSGILATAAFWAACRHNLVGPALGLWAFLAHLRWRETGRGRFLALSLAGFALALLSGEAAIAVLAYPLASACFAPRPERWRNVRSLLPLLLIGLIYLGLYCAYGFGAGRGSDYINPLSSPLGFLLALPGRLLMSVGIIGSGGAADVLGFDPAGHTLLAAFGLLLALMLLILWRRSWRCFSDGEKKALRWLLAGSILSSLPFAASMTISFHLVVPLFGWAAVAAGILRSRSRIDRSQRGWRTMLWQLAFGLLFFFQLVLSPLLRLTTPLFLKTMMSNRVQAAMGGLDRDFPDLTGKHLVILDAPDITIGFHSYFYRRLHRLSMPASWRVLHWGRNPADPRRVAKNSLEIEFEGGFQRPDFPPGKAVQLSDLKVAVAEAAGSIIRRIVCTFDRPLEDRSLLLLTWRDGRLQAAGTWQNESR